jgi:hypothetical protein
MCSQIDTTYGKRGNIGPSFFISRRYQYFIKYSWRMIAEWRLRKTLDRNRGLLEILPSLYLSGEVNKTTKTQLIYLVSPTEIETVFNFECGVSCVTDKMSNNNHLMRLFSTFFRGVLFNKDRRYLCLLLKEFKKWKNFDNSFRVYVNAVCVTFGAGTSKSVSRIGYRLDRWGNVFRFQII